jgi:hypothetical protein
VGIKAEAAALASISNASSGVLSVVTSYSLTGEYYLGDRMVRPFAGLGVGSYGAIIFDTDEFETIVKGKSVIGFAPRAGLQIGHFRLEAAYHLVQDTTTLA